MIERMFEKMALVAGVSTVCIGFAACGSLSPASTEESEFGHRTPVGLDGRTTIVLTAAEEGVEYRLFAATYESAFIRPDILNRTAQGTDVAVEVLIKGAFPDSCAQLHDVVQQRAGNLVLVTLTMRRPQGAICASVMRPYRFYLTLDGLFSPGPYSLKLNDISHPFVVRNLPDN